MQQLAAVIFDMDGLLLDTERVMLWAWQRAMADYGFDAPHALFLKTVGLTDGATDAIYRLALGDAFPVEAVRAREWQYAREYIAEHGAPLKAGVLDLLDLLDEKAIPRAVASSSHRRLVDERLGRAGLLPRVHVTISGDEVANGKPAPDIFLTAASRLEVPPAACLVLEDSEAGVQAAHAAGMSSIMVPDLRPPSPAVAALAYRIMPSLHQVRALLAEML